MDAANILFDTQLESQKLLESEYTGIAERAGINPQDVIVDFVGAATAPPPSTNPQAALNNPILTGAAQRNGVSVEDIWNNLSDEAKAQMSGGQ